jgi:hypothetical protein
VVDRHFRLQDAESSTGVRQSAALRCGFAAWASMLVLVVVGSGYRNKCKSPAFAAFFLALTLVHALLYVWVLSYFGSSTTYPSRSSNYGSAIRWRSACSDPRPTRVCGSVCIRIRRRRSGWRKIAIHQQPSGQPGREPCCVKRLYEDAVLIPIRSAVAEFQVAICDPERVHVSGLCSLPNRYAAATAFYHIGIERCAHKLQVLAGCFWPTEVCLIKSA